ncbi:hypothetical protein RYX36_023868, partial [Vicia faba]
VRESLKRKKKVHLGEEFSDVLLYLVRLSDICGVNLGKAALRKVELNAIKDPAKANKQVTNKEDEIENSSSADNVLEEIRNNVIRQCDDIRRNVTESLGSDAAVKPWVFVGDLNQTAVGGDSRKSVRESLKRKKKVHLGEEFSDVLLYLVRLSDICGVNLGKAALRKVELNAIKDPAKANKQVTNKEDEIENSSSADNGTA